jgi:hypothetical protein
MKITPERIQITCSRCGSLFPAGVWRIVDVQQDPDLKRQLLRGQINVNTCPNCGQRIAVGTPLAYHDSDKELFLILVPIELNLSGEEQEKAIGELTNTLMTSLPAEKRKGYLFQPKTFFSMRSLQEEILRADGVTAEMMQDQMEKSQLIQELLAQREDEAGLKTLVEEKSDQLDYEFFLLLTASIEEARQEGNEALSDQLAALRAKLLELTEAPGVPLPEDLEGEMTVEELIQELLAHKDEEDFKALVAVVRPLFDYQFFQALTGQIEAAQGKGEEEQAKELAELRSKILDLVDELDRESKEAIERANTLLRQILDSEDMLAAAEENLEQIDGMVLPLLELNIRASREAGQEGMAEKLQTLQEHIVSLLEARMPPEMRLINRLLSAEELEERQELLQEEAELVDDRFLQLLKLVSQDLRRQGHQKAAEHLEESVKQVEAMLQTGNNDISEG